MTFLLDVNVLIALIDPAHSAHDEAHAWFQATGSPSWATCPITQNGLVRIVGHARYPAFGSPLLVAGFLERLCQLPGHIFWPDDISIAGPYIDRTRIISAGQVTDTYLLALAKAHGGQLATFDRRLSTSAVEDGGSILHLIAG